MRSVLETVSPKKAAEWLKRNVNNRPLSRVWVDRLCQLVLDGQWQINGDPIRFDASGDLIDGQHRLHAILQSGKSVQSFVLRGLKNEAFDTLDQIHKRTGGDVLSRRGEKHYNILAAAVTRVWQYDNGKRFGCDAPRIDQLTATLDANAGLRVSVDLACSFRTKHISPSDLAFYIYKTRVLWGEDRSDPFWVAVASVEGLVRGTPAYLLYKRLYDDLASVAKLPRGYRHGFCVKAFNAYITNAKCKILKIGDGEECPRFVEPKR